MTRRLLVGLVVAAIAMVMAVNASAFDGNRKGFVIGIGVGPSITSWTDEEGSWKSDRENDFGVGTIFKIGYGVNENLLIYYTNNVAWFSVGDGESFTVTSGITALGGSYYLNTESPSLFINGLVGIGVWAAPFESNSESAMGLGLGAGIGYEFSKHFNVNATLMYGMPKFSDSEEKIKALNVLVTFNVLGY